MFESHVRLERRIHGASRSGRGLRLSGAAAGQEQVGLDRLGANAVIRTYYTGEETRCNGFYTVRVRTYTGGKSILLFNAPQLVGLGLVGRRDGWLGSLRGVGNARVERAALMVLMTCNRIDDIWFSSTLVAEHRHQL